MELNDFSSFFELFAGTCFLYAGSETFRFAFNDTILSINQSMVVLREKLRLKIGKQILNPELDNASEDEKRQVIDFLGELNDEKDREAALRQFPNGFKSIFLITGCYCLAILILGGFQQFFLCSLTAIVVLSALITLVLVYNLIIFSISFSPGKAGKSLKGFIPIFVVIIAVGSASFYIYHSQWLDHHYARHLAELKIPDITPEKTEALKKTFFSNHANTDERFWITLALLVAISPFIIHLLRIWIHKVTFRKSFRNFEARSRIIFEKLEKNKAQSKRKVDDEILEALNKFDDKIQ